MAPVVKGQRKVNVSTLLEFSLFFKYILGPQSMDAATHVDRDGVSCLG